MIPQSLRDRSALIVTLALTTAYAVLRYNVFKGVDWSQVPLYVLNKSVAWSSIVLFALAARHAVKTRGELAPNPRFVEGSALASLHVLMSLMLLAPANYPDFFDASARFKLTAGIAMLCGLLGTLSAAGARRATGSALLLSIAVFSHTTLLGAANWLTPAKWPGYMIPITLLSALAALAMSVLTFVWATRRAGR